MTHLLTHAPVLGLLHDDTARMISLALTGPTLLQISITNLLVDMPPHAHFNEGAFKTIDHVSTPFPHTRKGPYSCKP